MTNITRRRVKEAESDSVFAELYKIMYLLTEVLVSSRFLLNDVDDVLKW